MGRELPALNSLTRVNRTGWGNARARNIQSRQNTLTKQAPLKFPRLFETFVFPLIKDFLLLFFLLLFFIFSPPPLLGHEESNIYKVFSKASKWDQMNQREQQSCVREWKGWNFARFLIYFLTPPLFSTGLCLQFQQSDKSIKFLCHFSRILLVLTVIFFYK